MVLSLTYDAVQADEFKNIVQVYGRAAGGKKELIYQPSVEATADREEVVVKVQGYILRCSLPPITRPEQYVLFFVGQHACDI